VRASGFYRYGPPDVLEMVELPDLTPQAGEVRVRVEATTVNPADTLFRGGGLAAAVATAEPPYVAGLEFAGTVDAVGPEAGWETGATVMGITAFIPNGRGSHAEQVVVDARSVVDIPTGASMPEAATLPMNGLTARLALDRLGLAPGQTLAVTGAAGAVGGYVIQLASHEGISVVAISHEDDEELVREFGAHQFVSRGQSFADAVRELVGGGVDAVVDAAVIGREVLPVVRERGRVVCLRAFDGEPDRGISTELISVRAYATEFEKLRALAQLVEQGALTLRVAETFAPDRAAHAHARLEASGIRGRVVLAF
jgi:NADPH:quinone reductase